MMSMTTKNKFLPNI